MRNVATTVKNAIPMARNAVADPMTITSAGYMPRSLAQNFTGKQVVSQGTQATGYSKAGGTRLTGSMNNQSGRPYTTNRSVNGGGYSGQRIVEKTDYSGRALEKVNPLMPLVETPNSYGVMPIFGPERVVLPPAIIPPIVRDPLTRVEQIKQSWGSPEFQEWYKKQPPGTTQNYNGRPIKIVGGSGTLKREVYAKEDNKGNKLDTPVLVPDSTSTLPRSLYFRNYTKELQESEGNEADDIMATMAVGLSKLGQEVIILSGDNDMLPMISEKVKIARKLTKNKIEYVEQEYIKDKYGVESTGIALYKVLMGCDSDGVPPMTGMNKKTAIKLIGKYNEDVDSFLGKEWKNEDLKEEALRNHELTRLRKDVEVRIIKRTPEEGLEVANKYKLKSIAGMLASLVTQTTGVGNGW